MIIQTMYKRVYSFLLSTCHEIKSQSGFRIIEWILQEGIREFKYQSGWKIASGIFFGYYLASWILMFIFEPHGAEIVQWDIYWYFYIVVATTVGFGEFVPSTLGSRVVTVSVMFIGISTIIILIEQVGQTVFKISEKIWRGEMIIKRKNHIVIVGDRGSRTRKIFEAILADEYRVPRDLVLCFDGELSNRNPLSAIGKQNIGGVKVRDNFRDDEWLECSCISEAWRICIDVDDDDLAYRLAIDIKNSNPKAHIVIALNSMDNYDAKIRKNVSKNIECIPDGMAYWLVRSLQDRWTSDTIRDFIDPQGSTLYNIVVPDDFKECEHRFVKKYFKNLGASIIAVRDMSNRDEHDLSAGDGHIIKSGCVLEYSYKHRLNSVIVWDDIHKLKNTQA
ncbi:MAG: ion channel [Patescibacteria group bacterium]